MIENKEGHRKKNNWNWITWWSIDQPELDNQIDNYSTLSPFKSSRKISALLLILSALVTALLFFLTEESVGVLIEAIVIMIISFFVYYGKKWALITSMIIWTLEKALSLISDPSGAAVVYLWWTVYMRYFYLAYKVEVERKTIRLNQQYAPAEGTNYTQTPQTNPQINSQEPDKFIR